MIAALATALVGKFLLGDPSLNIAFGDGDWVVSRHLSMQLMQFIALSGTYVVIFFSYAWMLNAEDVLELIGLKRRNEVVKLGE